MGRGSGSSRLGAGSYGNKINYADEYIKNNPWIKNLNEESQKAIMENFNNMPKEEQFYYSLNSDEQRALADLQYSTKSLNEYMRGATDDFSVEQKQAYDENIKNIKSAISKYQVEKPMTLYRGINQQEFEQIKEGGKIESFKSTSTDIDRAKAFAENQGGYIVEYKINKSSRVADVNGVPNANEKEFLIDSGQRYKSVKKIGKRVIITL